MCAFCVYEDGYTTPHTHCDVDTHTDTGREKPICPVEEVSL